MRFKLFKHLILIAVLVALPLAWAHAYEEEPVHQTRLGLPQVAPDDHRAAQLKRDADHSLYLARHSIKINGFFCANIELNIWKNLAQRAGTFDEKIYEELKTELYTGSMRHMEKWFNYYLKRGFYNDAQKCLQTWRIHAMEIGKFDETAYEKKAAAVKGK